MTNYPTSIDDDLTIPTIEDGVTEISADHINTLRDAVITTEYVLGVNPQGSLTDLVTRLAVSLNDDGTLKASALTVPPVTNSMVAVGAGIVESKLSLNVPTSTLNTGLSSLTSVVSGISSSLSDVIAEFSEHVYGLPSDASTYINRHVASHIDINKDQSAGHDVSGVDPRDTGYNNSGLYKTNGSIRTSTDLMSVLLEINSDLINHLLSTANTHPASFITLSTANFSTIPASNNTVQKAIDYLDSIESSVFEEHRAELHSNGISKSSMVTSSSSDVYNKTYGPFTCSTSTVNNYDKIIITPGQADLDWAFRDTSVGDTVIVTYTGFTSSFTVESINYTPGSVYEIIINGKHPTSGSSCSIEKSHYDENKYGVLAVVPANHNYNTNSDPNFASIPASAIVIKPNCPQVVGLDLALDELDSTHYMLYIGYYPTGNPSDSNLKFPQIQGIDVTGNSGATPGQYTLSHVINTTNKAFRSGGYNFRFAAFEYKGQFGLALCDTVDNSGFSIISGTNSSTTLTVGLFANNVVGDATVPIRDPLGLGMLKAGHASPDYNGATTTNTPTKIFLGKTNKNYNVNGKYIDYLTDGYSTVDGYYNAYLTTLTTVGSRVKGTYRINKCLTASKLKNGSTIVVAPVLPASGTNFYFDYGRYTVESLAFNACPGSEYTDITVVTCTSLSGNANAVVTNPANGQLPVRIYFSEDSVNFNIDSGNHRKLFEIYVKRDGTTFSHMRSKFELSSGSSTTLQTDLGTTSLETNYGWHVVDVSPKLKGFIPVGASATALSKYIRFFILNYNSSDETFDGYIGQPELATPTSVNNGAIVKGRKGKVTRFYDYTGVDYVDILFQDNIESPLSITCPATESRYVDIQLFDSLQTNEEFMCIATCEQFIKGGPNATLWYFQDKRQFGTVSEKILSSSAISFIEASDRISKQNGVASGFEYISSTGTSFTVNGGTAIINGVIVNKNNFTVYSNKLYNPALTTTTVNYAVCLTKDNNYQLIPIADTAITTSYNVSTTKTIDVSFYTLSQIIESRKDLLPIYILPVYSTSATYTIGTPLDIRFFINDTEEKLPISVCGTTDGSTNSSTILGNCKSLLAASNYIKYSNNTNSVITIKGTVYLTESLSFSGKPVSIVGEKNNLVICSVDGVGINLSSNMEIVGVNFERRFGTEVADTAYSTAGYGKATIGLVMSNGAIYYDNITIKDCSFTTNASYRKSSAAHILFEQTGDGAILSNINICNNRFKEYLSQLCIAFVNKGGNTATATSIGGTIINDVTIENNKGNFGSYIMLSSDNYNGTDGTNSRGLSTYNLKICKNTFDKLWLNVSRSVMDSYRGSTSNFTYYYPQYPHFTPSVIISENSFISIEEMSMNGSLLNLLAFGILNIVNSPSPDIIVSNNTLSTLRLSSCADLLSTSTYKAPGEIIICNNVFNTSTYGVAGACLTISTNLLGTTVTDIKNVVNINNNIFQNKIKDYSSTTSYSIVIATYISANINNNNISNCIATAGYGIVLFFANSGTNAYTCNVTNNTISRGEISITNYIKVFGTTQLKSVVITDNYFDSTTINGISTTLISCSSGYEYKLTTQRNKNDTFILDLYNFVDDTNISFRGLNTFTLPGSVCGWSKSCNYMVTTIPSLSYSFTKNIVPSCASQSYTAASYSVNPLILNIPYVDGANLSSLQLTVRANLVSNKAVQVIALSQDSLSSSDAILTSLSTQFTVTTSPTAGAGAFTANGILTFVTIDMSTLSAKYALESNSRTLPLYIFFAIDMSTTPVPFTFTKSDPYYDSTEYFNIYAIKGTFTY